MKGGRGGLSCQEGSMCGWVGEWMGGGNWWWCQEVQRWYTQSHTLSQARSHTPSGSEGQRVDKTTFKCKQGLSDRFSHTHTQTHTDQRAGSEGHRVDYSTLHDHSLVFHTHIYTQVCDQQCFSVECTSLHWFPPLLYLAGWSHTTELFSWYVQDKQSDQVHEYGGNLHFRFDEICRSESWCRQAEAGFPDRMDPVILSSALIKPELLVLCCFFRENSAEITAETDERQKTGKSPTKRQKLSTWGLTQTELSD